jgi:hypothetical protein
MDMFFLSDVDKKRLLHRLGQFYEYEKEFIKHKNLNAPKMKK